jgi:general secretion pathway protein C
MRTFSLREIGIRAVTLVVWALAAGSLTYWGLRLANGQIGAAQLPATVTAPASVDALAVARALGASTASTTTPVNAASRFVLLGVVAGSPHGDAALIAIDGKSAQPFPVGAALETGLVLQSATARQATLGATRDGPVLFTLDMPPLK